MDKYLLVDGNNILVRSLRATEKAQMSAPDGTPTGALVVFINTLSRYVREVEPDYLVVCWDGGRSLHRTAIYADYKGTRHDKPEHEQLAFEQAKTFLTLAGLHHVEVPDVEADDLIAYYWRQADPNNLKNHVTILSNDKDFMQLLLGDTVQIRVSSANTPTDYWGGMRVIEEREVHPTNIPLVMALSGDTSDNIPGVPRYGWKTAVKVLRANDWNLDQALDNTPNLAGYREHVLRNLALVDLRRGPLGLDLPCLPPFTPTTPFSALYGDLVAFLDRYRMASCLDRLTSGSLWRDTQPRIL